MPSRRDFVRTFAGATAGAYVMSRGIDGHLSALQAPAARRQVTIGGKTGTGHRYPLSLRDRRDGHRQGDTAGERGRRWREPGPRAATSSAHGQDRRRRPGADHQRLLVVRSERPRSCRPHRQGAERGAREVGLDAPAAVRGDGISRAAASRSRSATARGRRQAARTARRLDRRTRQWRGSVAAEVRPILGQGRGARRARGDASGRRRQHPQGGCAARAGRSREHHRQSARDDVLPFPADLRRHLRQVPGAACLRGTRRWLSAVLPRTIGSGVRSAEQREVREQEETQRVP